MQNGVTMNREIIFRGKRTDNHQWVEGYYGSHSGIEAFILDRPYISVNNTLEAINYWEVDPSTIGQYTGLKDKNGKRIFEGDVCQIKNHPLIDNLPFVVEWEDFVYNGWIWRDLDDVGAVDSFTNGAAKQCEVIGNIHDNPELIGEEK